MFSFVDFFDLVVCVFRFLKMLYLEESEIEDEGYEWLFDFG